MFGMDWQTWNFVIQLQNLNTDKTKLKLDREVGGEGFSELCFSKGM